MKSIIAAVLVACSSAQAAQEVKLCATPANGKTYMVDATWLYGSELNQKTGTFRYTGQDRYAVIFWKDHEATVIHLDFPGIVGPMAVKGTDQEDRSWTITQNSGVCY